MFSANHLPVLWQMIVLGGNYFRINHMQSEFQPPPVCGDSVGLTVQSTK